MSTVSSSSRKMLHKMKPSLPRQAYGGDKARKKLMFSASQKNPMTASPSPLKNIPDDSNSEDDQNFQISVSIGGDKKQIKARLDQRSENIALRFINEHGINIKFLKDLTKLIDDQIQ